MGLLYILQLSATSPWGSAEMVNWTIPFFSISLFFNVAVTIAIVSRLFYLRRKLVAILPHHSNASQYTNIAANIIESSLLTSVFYVLCVVPFTVHNAVANVFLPPLGQVQVCANIRTPIGLC
jgi:hypothetical protein